MKKFLFFLALILAVSCNNPKSTIPQLKYCGLNGEIESVKEEYYNAEELYGEIVTKALYYSRVIKFNSFGFISEIVMNGETKILSYNDKGELISFNAYPSFHTDNYIDSFYSLTKRDKNQAEFQAEDGAYLTYSYNDLRTVKYNKDGEMTSILKYNNKGQIIELIYCYLQTKRIYTYDSKGLLETLIYYFNDENNKMEFHYEYKDFDKKGNWTTQLEYDGNNEIQSIIKREITYK